MLVLVLGVIALLAAACGSSSSGASSKGAPTLRIASPTNGATVGRQFVVKFDSNQAIGDPSSGEDHVHLYYDGKRSTDQADYDKAYGKSFTVTRLGPGRHTIEAVLANADHSLTDVHTRITVTVSAHGGAQPATPPTTTGSGSYGY